MFFKRFLKQGEFNNYDDYLKNAVPNIPENFNFAYDVVDVIADETPDKVAILWTDDAGEKKSITFKMLAQWSNAVANFLTAHGLKKGDTVLLFMRRRWEYWVLMMAMHKLGVIPIPSTNQLKTKDIKYRFDAADVAAVIAYDDGVIINEIKSQLITFFVICSYTTYEGGAYMQNLELRKSYTEYVVQKGDSLYTIAQKYGVSVSELTDINMLTSNVIYPNQVLLIPKVDDHSEFLLDVYVTKEYDTFDNIAKSSGVDVEKLAMYNDVGSLFLEKGQKIYLPKERTYVIDSSDTVESVLRKTKKTAEELLIANASSWLKSGTRIVS